MTAEGLHARYNPPHRSWVRANFIASLDGGATLNGRSGGLGSPTDQRVLSTLRDHADVVLVGAGTVRAESYRAPHPSEPHRGRRLAAGLAEFPRLAVVTGGTVTGQESWIADAPVPPLVLTTQSGASPIPTAEVVACGSTAVSIGLALAALTERGLVSVLCEGGPSLFSQLSETGALDELCLTCSPLLVGPGAPRIVDGPRWAGPRRARLTGLLEADSMLFCRYEFR